MSSSNLNTLLKQQIKDAIAAIYDEQGTQAANRYSNPEQLSKALLDLLFPDEAAHNTEVTGVVRVPTINDEVKASDSESTDSKKERKKRGPMSDEAKAAMKAKRDATIAAKAAAAAPAPAEAAPASPKAEEAKPEPEAPGAPKKERKPRGPMSDEAKAQMKAKREATIAAKKAAAE
jgi:hypothetical protein